MKSKIAKTAIVDKRAIIENGVEIGPYSIVEGEVVIKKGTVLEDHVLIKDGTIIGENNRICHSAFIGGEPQDINFKSCKSCVKIGNGNIIREFATIHKASTKNKFTEVGDNCFIMAYVHIAHDCEIGNNVIIANATQIGGFVKIEDYAFLSALIPVHQFSKIGGYSMTGGGFRIVKDVIPYGLAGGEPLRIFGLNIVGLRRNNFSKETINILKKAFNIILDKKLNTAQAVEKIKNTLPQTTHIKNLLRFIKESKRGIAKR